MAEHVSPRLCGARTRAGGMCKRLALTGTNRCQFHGGASPQAQRKAAERLAEQKARAVLAELGEDIAPVTDALAALEDVAGQTMALVNLLKGKVAELTELRYASGMGLEQTRAELTLYVSVLGRAESVLSKIIGLNLEGRRVQLNEARIAFVVGALSRVVSHRDLGLDEGAQRRARAMLARELGAPTVTFGTVGESIETSPKTRLAGRCLVLSDTGDVPNPSLAPIRPDA